ncbi:MAG TPA: methionyl-tRNA formyltransferase [Glaciibacter sp.]|nr:methionyl-tRNA formyltransferase [Glaciibacter sp.]
MKLIFAGTPEAAVPSLDALARSGHEIVAVLTRTDAPLGRKRVLTPSPVADAAERLGLPVIKANRLDASVTDTIAALQPDLGVIVAYGGLVREPLLSTPRLGWINLHFSLLPRWRGAAPVQRALIAGDATTGAAVFQLVAELDAGPVFDTVTHPVSPGESSGELLATLSVTGATLLLSVVDGLADGTATAVEQTGVPTLAPKLTIEDARIDWTEPADAVSNRIRGVTPEPGAFTTIGDARLKVLGVLPAADVIQPPGHIRIDGHRVLAGTGTHALELLAVQPAGKKPMNALDWWRGISATEVAAS